MDAIASLNFIKQHFYLQGYVKRQALYACMSCIPLLDDGVKPGGICLACSYHCHEGHELVELYTKR